METIQVVIDKKLLQATNKAARQAKSNRSAFIREVLRQHLRKLEILAMEEQEREGYRRIPQDMDEVRLWEKAAVWPDD